MKIKLAVLISLIIFALGIVGLIIAGFLLPEGTGFGGSNVAVNDGPGSSLQQVDENGTPIVQPEPSGATPSPGATTNGTGSGPTAAGQPATNPSSSTASPTAPTATQTTKPATSASVAPKPTTTVAPPPSSPPPATACGSPGGICSAAQVATHNSSSNCWVIYNGGYYIVSAYANQHPGGTSVFNSATCGKDITAYMTGSASTAGSRHKHSGGAYNTLNSYYVGKVQ